MTNIQALASEDESSPKWQSKQTEEIEEEREKDATEAETMKQEDSAENTAKDPQTIYASNRKDDLRPIYEIVLERKTTDTTEPHEPESDPEKKKKKTETINPLLMEEQKVRSAPNIHKEESDSSSVRMEKSEKTIEPEDSEIQRKKEIEIIEFLPIKGQGAKPAAEIDEKRSNKHSAIKDHEKKKI